MCKKNLVYPKFSKMPNGVHLVVNDARGQVTVVNDISLKIKFPLYESFTCDFSQLISLKKKKQPKNHDQNMYHSNHTSLHINYSILQNSKFTEGVSLSSHPLWNT